MAVERGRGNRVRTRARALGHPRENHNYERRRALARYSTPSNRRRRAEWRDLRSRVLCERPGSEATVN